MRIHLLRNKEVSEELYQEVVLFLQSFNGPASFHAAGSLIGYNDEDLEIEEMDETKFYKQKKISEALECSYRIPEQRPIVTWNEMFERCNKYRVKKNLDRNDFVFLLTDVANEHNWFSALDPENLKNGFVHTADWEFYVRCNPVYPITYLVACLVLQEHFYGDPDFLTHVVHDSPLGCMNDFCGNKKEVLMKLRTADICYDCIETLKQSCEPLVLQQMLDIFEGVRTRMLFNQNFRQNVKPSKLFITKSKKIILEDFNKIEINLRPLEKTLYLFFLQHPEGVMLHDLTDHKAELLQIYSRISTSGLSAEIHNRIDGLVDVNSNSASEKISKIKAAFVNAIGTELSKHYIIWGENGEAKRIGLDRELVVRE